MKQKIIKEVETRNKDEPYKIYIGISPPRFTGWKKSLINKTAKEFKIILKIK